MIYFRAPSKNQVTLKFQSFNLGKQLVTNSTCTCDFLEVRDGEDSNAPLLGTFCGKKMPEDIKSTTNSLWIKFVSDGSVQTAGFSGSLMSQQAKGYNISVGQQKEVEFYKILFQSIMTKAEKGKMLGNDN